MLILNFSLFHHQFLSYRMNRNPTHSTPVKKDDAAAMAAVLFDDFSSASTMRNILALYRSICDTIAIRAAPINEFYPKLKSKIRSWKAQALWKKFDARASHKGLHVHLELLRLDKRFSRPKEGFS